MNLLLDTHVFLWSLFSPEKLSEAIILQRKMTLISRDRDFKSYHQFGLRTLW